MNEFRQNILNKLPQFSLDDFNYFLKESQKKVESLNLAKDCCIHTSYIDCIDAEYIRCKYCLLNCGFKCIGITVNGGYKTIDGKRKYPETKVYKIRGSHRDERNIKSLLGFDPGIHSGMAGKGAFCAVLTAENYNLLVSEGFKVNKKPIR